MEFLRFAHKSKPSFDFVDTNEHFTAEKGSDDDTVVIRDQKNQDEDEDIWHGEAEEGESPSDYYTNYISIAIDTANHNENFLELSNWRFWWV